MELSGTKDLLTVTPLALRFYMYLGHYMRWGERRVLGQHENDAHEHKLTLFWRRP